MFESTLSKRTLLIVGLATIGCVGSPSSAGMDLPGSPPAPPLAVARRPLLEPKQIFASAPSDAVARFRPQVDVATGWSLSIAERGGPEIAVLSGDGNPPSEIVWDGRTLNGGLAWPGLRYDYVFSFRDPTGVGHHVAGEEFTVPAYTCTADSSLSILFTGAAYRDAASAPADTTLGPCMRQTVALLRRRPPDQRLRIEVLAHGDELARTLGEELRAVLSRELERDPVTITVYAGRALAAPPGGTVQVTSTATR
jgi:hypothetical protein